MARKPSADPIPSKATQQRLRSEYEALQRSPPRGAGPTRVIVEMRPSAALGAAGSRANLRPLFDGAGRAGGADGAGFGVSDAPRFFLADLPDAAASPWDLAHARVADQLGVSPADVLFVEPDLVHPVFLRPDEGMESDCTPLPQNGAGGQATHPDDGWHLGPDHSQLRAAQQAVQFTERRTRIAHLDTGYDRAHASVPLHLLTSLERSFVEDDPDPGSAQDPDGSAWPIDNTGHGTGTLGILAGREVAALGGAFLGGAPHADVVPLRIADSVVLLKTSAFARALDHAIAVGCDVVSMSMGGLPSRAWRKTVDRAYEAGVCIVTAAGNNFNGLPTRHMVYPARYGRVIGVAGIMADSRPYAGIGGWRMEGNYGPKKKMEAAMAAYTPNIPWAMYRCSDGIRMNGGGTSSATPQVAAAVALWYEKYKDRLPRDWRRVEAVRHALKFTAATESPGGDPFDVRQVGWGVLRAADALALFPALDRPKTKSDQDFLPLLRILTGLGIDDVSPREQMFNLELAQRWLLNPDLQELLEDPGEITDLTRLGDPKSAGSTLRKLMDAIVEDTGASNALRRQVAARYPMVSGTAARPTKDAVVPEVPVACEATPPVRAPSTRRLRVYAVDPSLSAQLDTAEVNEATLEVRWEALHKGPVGEYVAIYDYDASGRRYPGVDLDDPRLLAQDGCAPSEGNAQFHQQMVYAVAMKTIGHFEKATGRPAFWRPKIEPDDPFDDRGFVQQLKVRPHALHQANAYYSSESVSLDFGYFDAPPGTRVYTCLSHDIIAHETTHALLDGMHRRFREPTNPDVLAFHEAFADIVALMQHFTLDDFLQGEIARTRGDLGTESLLGSLAVQFGRATGRRGALREAIGWIENGVWTRREPDPDALKTRLSPHARGAILVAAVFDAFLAIYRKRTADLLRLYTDGTGVLPEGAIHPDLVRRLAAEAATAAGHVSTICIRALDYLPPVDITFFEYLRALITADYDLVPDDRFHYRVAFVEAFRRHGIDSGEIFSSSSGRPRTLSVDTLRWRGLPEMVDDEARTAIEAASVSLETSLRKYADACTYFEDRERLFEATWKARRDLQSELKAAFAKTPGFARFLGLDPKRTFEVHALRRAMRTSPDGRVNPQVILSITQTVRRKADRKSGTPAHDFRGGTTLVVDLSPRLKVRYSIFKRVGSAPRQERTAAFLKKLTADPLLGLVFGLGIGEPFAALHGFGGEAP